MRRALHKWIWVHKWSSLLCTLFLLLLCVTGLPLIFLHEIHEALEHETYERTGPLTSNDHISIDRLIALGKQRFPNHLLYRVSISDEHPHATVFLTPSFEALRQRPAPIQWVRFDLQSGDVVKTREQAQEEPLPIFVSTIQTLMTAAAFLHINLYMGLIGQFFLGLMGLLFVASIVSGAVLYGPFMKRTAFGTIRAGRLSRLRWLDLHNLLGIVTLAWAAMVGITGVINNFAVPLNLVWQAGVQAELRTGSSEAWPPPQDQMVSVQGALNVVRTALPGISIRSISFPIPGPRGLSPDHYILRAVGDTPLTEKLSTVALVNVRTGTLDRVLEMPWYLQALELSRPLHFGDYGGLPLKIIWALLDLITIVVLCSGLYLWLSKRKSPIEARYAELESGDQAAVIARVRSAME